MALVLGYNSQAPVYSNAAPGGYSQQAAFPGRAQPAYSEQAQPTYSGQAQPAYMGQAQPAYMGQAQLVYAQPPYASQPAQPQAQGYLAQPQAQGYPVQPQAQSQPMQPQGYPAPQAPSPYPTYSAALLPHDGFAPADRVPSNPSTSGSASASASGPGTPPPAGGSGWVGDTTRPPIQKVQKAETGSARRLRFIKLTYLHLFGAILVFAGLLRLFMTNEVLYAKVSAPLITFALGGRWNWGVVLAAFMAASWVADYWAGHAASRVTQYAGLLFYVLAEALIFVPLLAIVEWKTAAILARGGAEPHILRDAAFVTLGIFTMLTLSVVISRKDFSFLRGGLATAGGAALSLIVLSLMFGFNLGLLFSVAMVLLAAGYVLYQTSQVLAHYHPGQHVAAALALFSSVALMFWYVIRIFLRARQ
ncbi:MAG TPA: Bax inhibitor-1 family protein [Kofleriaceae bacterium]|nr:Bax inhibitor-1 family protein [Kofleriaceae bacterium]